MMIWIRRPSACVALAFLLSTSFFVSISKPASSPPAVARKEDVQYLKCAVCNELSEALHLLVSKKRTDLAPKQLTEYQIIELAENICNLKRNEGDWILHQDIVEEGDKLVLVEQVEEGECGTECKTVEKTCQEVMGYHDMDVAEYIYKGTPTLDRLSKFLCKDLTKVCSVKIPPVPKDRKPGEGFLPKSSKDAEIERIMRSMSDIPGAPGMKVYSKEDLMNGMPNFNEEEDDDDDDDDDDNDDEHAPIKDKMVKRLEGSESLLGGMKTKAQQLVKTTQRYVARTFDEFLKWWSGKSPRTGKSRSSSTEL